MKENKIINEMNLGMTVLVLLTTLQNKTYSEIVIHSDEGNKFFIDI